MFDSLNYSIYIENVQKIQSDIIVTSANPSLLAGSGGGN
jgi:sporulation protein YlmC with PRC-barrel domain